MACNFGLGVLNNQILKNFVIRLYLHFHDYHDFKKTYSDLDG